jgi:hypothetical protein
MQDHPLGHQIISQSMGIVGTISETILDLVKGGYLMPGY